MYFTHDLDFIILSLPQIDLELDLDLDDIIDCIKSYNRTNFPNVY